MGRARFLVAVAIAAMALSVIGPASADCAAPFYEPDRRTVTPGDELRITGFGWGDACNDTPGPGCNPPPLGEPSDDISLALQRRGSTETFELTTIDASDEYSIDVTVTIPEIPPGKYELVDERNEGSMPGGPIRVTRH